MSHAAPTRRGRARQWAPALLALALAACAPHATPPSAAAPPPRPIDLTGITVMVLPAQAPASTPLASTTAFDAELDYWLKDRAPRVRWVPTSEVERLAAGSPTLRVDLHALDVRPFGRMRVRRIGDPLFGDVHNLGAMLDARLALLPAALAYVSPHDSTGAPLPGPGHVEVTAALIQTFGGEVGWYAVVAGEAGPIDAPATIASAARALARALTAGT